MCTCLYVAWSIAKAISKLILEVNEEDGDVVVTEHNLKLVSAVDAEIKTYSNDSDFIPFNETPDRPKVGKRILLDLFHALNRFTDTIPANHPLKPLAVRMIRDRFCIPLASDVKLVENWLVKNEPGVTLHRKQLSHPKWVNQRVRRVLLEKTKLLSCVTEFKELLAADVWKDANGNALLTEEGIKSLDNLMVHIEEECLADPEGFSYYREVGVVKQLPVYRCLRGNLFVYI